MKHFVLQLFCMLCFFATEAKDTDIFEIGGLYYNILSEEDKTAEVSEAPFGTQDYNPTGSITIPSKVLLGGKEYSVKRIGQFAFSNCRELSSITLPEGLETIEELAFSHCASLSTIEFPKTLKSIKTYAFEGCPFKSLEMTDSITEMAKAHLEAVRYLT